MTLMRYGHSPDAIEDYSLRDCRLFMAALPTIHAVEWAGMGGFDG